MSVLPSWFMVLVQSGDHECVAAQPIRSVTQFTCNSVDFVPVSVVHLNHLKAHRVS